MSELERVRKVGMVTARLSQWKGLLTAVVGAGVVVLTLTTHFYPSWPATVLGMAGLALALWLVVRHYATTLGAVNLFPADRRFFFLSAVLGSSYAILQANIGAFFAFGVVAAAIMVMGAFTGGVFRGYYLGAGVLSVVAVVYVFRTATDPAALLIIAGTLAVMVGLLDHLNLTRLLKTAPKDDYAAA